jgi:SAM-dependent methyltransferase
VPGAAAYGIVLDPVIVRLRGFLLNIQSEPGYPETGMVTCTVCNGQVRSLGEKNSFPLYSCKGCGHLFVWPIPESPQEIYSEDYFHGGENGFGYIDYDRDKAPMADTFRRYLKEIARNGKPKGTMLDVGAATGFFLDIARGEGWETYGIELSWYAAEVARGKGLRVSTGTTDDCDFPAGFFDVVTAWDVIEHMPKPLATLEKIHSLLKPGGLLVINTPDSGCMLARLLGKSWHLVVPPEHLNLFHRRSLKFMLEKTGYSVVHRTTVGKRFTLQYIFMTMRHWQKLRVWDRVASYLQKHRLGSVELPINLHDNMFVIARKSGNDIISRRTLPSRSWPMPDGSN